MNGSQNNAFTAWGGDSRSPHNSLASMLAPLRAETRKIEAGGCSLRLSPTRVVDAVSILPETTGEAEAVALISDMVAGRPFEATAEGVTRRLGLSVAEELDGDALVLDLPSLIDLVTVLKPSSMLSVVVEGPIESGDARAMHRAVETGRSPLEVEVRAVAALRVVADQSVILDVRDQRHALRLLSEAFRAYMAALRRRPTSEIDGPEPWQLDRLLQVSGTLTVRPIETEIFSTAVDVGISTSVGEDIRPADLSLIYDIFSNTWHDEA